MMNAVNYLCSGPINDIVFTKENADKCLETYQEQLEGFTIKK